MNQDSKEEFYRNGRIQMESGGRDGTSDMQQNRCYKYFYITGIYSYLIPRIPSLYENSRVLSSTSPFFYTKC